MASGRLAETLRDMRALFGAGSMAGVDDDELLRRFVARRDTAAEAAFAVLVARYGPLVLGTCRRALVNEHAAEDAFQATFLVLARRASRVRGDTLGPWLYGVARRVARRAAADAQRRRHSDASSLATVADGAADAAAVAERHERAALVDEEVARLPAHARAPLILCDLGGLTHEQAAARLGWPVGTVKSRQARARRRLRERLVRRGLAPALVVSVWESATSGALAPTPRLVRSTVEVVQWFAARGLVPPAGTVPAAVVAAAESTLRAMAMTKLKLGGAATVLGVSALLGLAAVRGQDAFQPTDTSAAPRVPDGASRPQDTTSLSITAPRALNAVPTGSPAGPGQADRMQALEEKLDRLLQVLESRDSEAAYRNGPTADDRREVERRTGNPPNKPGSAGPRLNQ